MSRFIVFFICAAFLGCSKHGNSPAVTCVNGKMAVTRPKVKVNPEVFATDFKKFIVVRKPGADRAARMEITEIQNESERNSTIQNWMDDESIDYVEPDYPITVEQSALTDDPSVAKQWALSKMDAGDAWKYSTGNREIVVGVIDSGMEITHPDLAANIWTNPGEVVNGLDDDGNGYVDDIHGWDFANNDNNPAPDSVSGSRHATHVAGIIGATANNHLGIAGIAPNVRIMPLRFITDTNGGATSNAIKALNYAIEKKVDIVNMSFGSTSYSQAFNDALTRAQAAGILVVVAAGNNQLNLDQHEWYPTKYPQANIITVAATNSADVMWVYGNEGSNYSTNFVDVAAPGVNILSTVNGDTYGLMTGTSMAAPMVSGLAVLLKGMDPSLGYQQLISALKKGVDPLVALKTRVASAGRVNALAALQATTDKALVASQTDSRLCTQ